MKVNLSHIMHAGWLSGPTDELDGLGLARYVRSRPDSPRYQNGAKWYGSEVGKPFVLCVNQQAEVNYMYDRDW